MLTKWFIPLFVRKSREPSTANRPSVTNECHSRRGHWRITAYCTHHCYSTVFASYEEKEKNSFQTFPCSYVHSRGKIICCKGFFCRLFQDRRHGGRNRKYSRVYLSYRKSSPSDLLETHRFRWNLVVPCPKTSPEFNPRPNRLLDLFLVFLSLTPRSWL